MYTKDKIKKDPKQIGCEGADQNQVQWQALKYQVMTQNDTSDSMKDFKRPQCVKWPVFVQGD